MPHTLKLSVPMFLHWLLDCLTRAYISTKAGGSFFYSTGSTFVGYFVTRRMTKESVLFPVTIYQHSVQYSSQTGTVYQTQPSHNKLPVSHFKKLTWENKVKAWARVCILGLWSSPGESSLLPTDLPPIHSGSEITSRCLEYQREVCTRILEGWFQHILTP